MNRDHLYTTICTTFSVIVVLSNILSAKMVPLPYVDFVIPAGLITYPLTFLLGDLVTEIFGTRKAKTMVFTALGMNLLCFGLIQIAILLPGNDTGFKTVLGLSGLRIFSSLTAYVISQVADIHLYSWIKKWTGSRFLWLRNNGSTLISQLIDTVVIDILFLYLGLGMDRKQVVLIMLFSFAYKTCFSISCTPLFYLSVFLARGRLKQATN